MTICSGEPMKIVDEACLNQFRGLPRCEVCGEPTPGGTEAAHYLARGMGGGNTIDHRLNVCGIGRICCHAGQHYSSNPPASALLNAIAKRERMYADEVSEWLWTVQRLPKGSTLPPEPGRVDA